MRQKAEDRDFIGPDQPHDCESKPQAQRDERDRRDEGERRDSDRARRAALWTASDDTLELPSGIVRTRGVGASGRRRSPNADASPGNSTTSWAIR